VTYQEIEETNENGDIIKKIIKVVKEKYGSKKRVRYHHGFIAQEIQEN